MAGVLCLHVKARHVISPLVGQLLMVDGFRCIKSPDRAMNQVRCVMRLESIQCRSIQASNHENDSTATLRFGLPALVSSR